MAPEDGEVASERTGVGASDDVAQVCERLPLPRIRSEIGLEFFFREIPRIDVFPRWCGVNREKRFARVLERRRNRALIQ